MLDLLARLGFDDEASPFRRAVYRGARAADVGEAFYEGYQAAIARLVSGVGADARASFCVTESSGGHPRAMRCALTRTDAGYVLDGEKTFVTGADRASRLLVVAREGERSDGTPKLRVVWIEADAPGITRTPLPATPFAPSIAHAAIRLAGVAVSEILPGDGYLGYVKPFRTVEDVHVLGAIAAHLVVALETIGGEDERIERLLAGVVALAGLAPLDPSDPATHLALAGTLIGLRAALEGIDDACARHPDAARGRALLRDLVILRVAENVRKARLEAAWKSVR